MSIKNPQNLLKLALSDKRKFLESFDYILTDCDGVVWQLAHPIPGIGEAVEKLHENGKYVKFLTNNSIRTNEEYKELLKKNGIKANIEDVIHPALSIVDYLKLINFSGLIYSTASKNCKAIMLEAGFDVIDGPGEIADDLILYVRTINDKQPVKAVVMDANFNLISLQLNRTLNYLSNPDCLFIAGCTDESYASGGVEMIGPGKYVKLIEEMSKRKATVVGKPGAALKDVLFNKLNITDPTRVLFVGDTLLQDIGFGHLCGFQTLLVLTGATSLEKLQNHTVINEVPDYYMEKFSDFVTFFNEI